MSTTDKKTLITDKGHAIDLLCQSDKVWDNLSERLKNDPEVILYYQPMGERTEVDTVDLGVKVTDVTHYINHRFTYAEGVQVPAFALNVPGFDLKKYIKIQETMKDLSVRRETTSEDRDMFTSEQGEYRGDYYGENNSTTTIYSRTPLQEMNRIRKIVAEISGELITDEDMAIRLLSKTNKAWDLISPELKMNPKVVMAYQPSAILWNVFSDGKGLVSDGYVEEGFELCALSGTVVFVPACAKEIPNFDYYAYMKLQGKVFQNPGYHYATKEELGGINNLFGENPVYVDDRKGPNDVSVFWQLHVIDRNALKRELGVEIEPQQR